MFRLNQLYFFSVFLAAGCGVLLASPVPKGSQKQTQNGNYRLEGPPRWHDKNNLRQEQDYQLLDIDPIIDPFVDRRTGVNRKAQKTQDALPRTATHPATSSSILKKDTNYNANSNGSRANNDFQKPEASGLISELVDEASEANRFGDRLSSRRQIELIDFVHYNLPDMEEPLLLLEMSDPTLFQMALASIDQSVTKLEKLLDLGNQDAYDRALAGWKIDAEIKIATVELSFADTPKLVRDLERLIEKQYEMRIQFLKADRDRLLANLDRIEKTIEKLEANPSEEIQRKMNLALRAAAKSRKNEVQPVGQKPSDWRSKSIRTPARSSRTNEDFLSPIMQHEFVLPKR